MPKPARVIIKNSFLDTDSEEKDTYTRRMYLDPTTDKAGWLNEHPNAIVTDRATCYDEVEVPVGILTLTIVRTANSVTYYVGYIKHKRGTKNRGCIQWEGGNGFPVVHYGAKVHYCTKKEDVHIVSINGVQHRFHVPA